MAGQGIVEFLTEGQQFGCADMMRGKSGTRSDGLDWNKIYGAGRGLHGTVNEEDGVSVGDLFGKVRRPLLAVHDAHGRIRDKADFCPVSEKRPDAVIFAERIAAGKDETSGRSLSH
jgi:hypothetical protein